MRKNKLSTAGLAAILSVALISGGIFAWFASKDTAAQVDVSTGDVIIDLHDFEAKSSEILPGSSVDLTAKGGGNAIIENKGTKAAVIELDLSEKSLKAVLEATFDPATAKDWDPAFAADYVLEPVTEAGVTEDRYVFAPSRLAEIASLTMDTDTSEGWTTVDGTGKYYTLLEGSKKLELKGLKLKVEQELGGNVGPKGGTQTPSRQFEQNTKFIIDVTAMGTQATSAAVKELYSEEALNALRTNGFVIPD